MQGCGAQSSEAAEQHGMLGRQVAGTSAAHLLSMCCPALASACSNALTWWGQRGECALDFPFFHIVTLCK